MKSVIVIPARLESTRLPRKMLLDQTGKSLIEHTYRAASRSVRASQVVVATDDEQIMRVVKAFGGTALMTDRSHRSGSDRVAEVARQMPDVDHFVNVQGDEPEIAGEAIDLAIQRLESTPDATVATLATPIRDPGLLHDPSCVKVVFDANFKALYFSRSLIPMPRGWSDEQIQQACEATTDDCFFQHVGLYAYRREFLLEIPTLSPTRLELTESLEQLRFLESGKSIFVDLIDDAAGGIDTREDYELFVKRQANC